MDGFVPVVEPTISVIVTFLAIGIAGVAAPWKNRAKGMLALKLAFFFSSTVFILSLSIFVIAVDYDRFLHIHSFYSVLDNLLHSFIKFLWMSAPFALTCLIYSIAIARFSHDIVKYDLKGKILSIAFIAILSPFVAAFAVDIIDTLIWPMNNVLSFPVVEKLIVNDTFPINVIITAVGTVITIWFLKKIYATDIMTVRQFVRSLRKVEVN
ncbi:MAG: hypothetical protein LBR22_01240 [Desulfovibrio sp.]|jgi:hypothetical protein|nr:hypothetical protein [Desulfovibrio sp.]